MTFAISPAALTNHATAMRGFAGSIEDAKTYADDHMTIALVDTSLLFFKARDQVEELRTSLTSYLNVLCTADEASATELDAVATNSLAVDDALEAELDAEYPDSGKPPVSIEPDSATDLACITAPETALTDPPTSAPTDLATEILTTNWLSPSSVIDQAIGFIAGLAGLESPLTVVGKQFGGDWDKLYECSAAVDCLADYLDLQATGRRAAMLTTSETWEGEAATAATTFFATQADILNSTAESLRATAPEFDAIVRGIRATAGLAASTFSFALDSALVAWGCYAAGAATVWTGIGGIIGGVCGTGVAALSIYYVGELIKLCQGLLSIVDALTAVIGVASTALLGTPALPQVVAYDNALV